LLAASVAVASCASAPDAATGRSWRSISCVSAVGAPPDASDSPAFSTSGWKTDFNRHCVPLSEISSGGPPRDGIPPLDRPVFVATSAADSWLRPTEPVIAVADGEVARAYPLQILIWHEIVNDTLGGKPIVVTFCPLCNASLVFERVVSGQELTFGTTGNLRYSDLVMWDRQTESWWQQATGEAIVGALTPAQLTRVPSLVLSYEVFKRTYPRGMVLSRDGAEAEVRAKTGHGRDYGTNPYVGYDRADSPPFLFRDRALDGRLPPKAVVAVATFADPPVAYRVDGHAGSAAVNDAVAGRRVLLLYATGLASPLDKPATSAGADVGQAALFDPSVDGRVLTFESAPEGRFLDRETRTTWLVSGVAIAGALAGRRLARLEHEVTYWFIWSVFRPETEVRPLQRSGAWRPAADPNGPSRVFDEKRAAADARDKRRKDVDS
jgi:hypothetical protein